MKPLLYRLLLSFLLALALGAVLSALSPGAFLAGWLAAFALAFPGLFCLLSAWSWAGGGKTLAWMVTLALLLRLGVGIGASLALPLVGYDEPTQKAGYLFYDSFRRDQEAWKLAQSGQPLWASFGEQVATDQYGGLMALSAGIYRYLSPDSRRPFLILLAGALVFALGVPFFWQALKKRWNPWLANLATWLLVLYPDGVLFGSSQLREPFLIGLTAVALWGVLTWRSSKRWAGLALLASLAGLALFSSRAALGITGVLVVWFLLENLAQLQEARRQYLAWGLLAVGGVLVAALSYSWLRSSAEWDLSVTFGSSGMVQYLVARLGERLLVPFLVGYGLAQPVLPAAIADPSLPFWQTLAIVRAAGWYALAPLLLYAFYAVWKAQPAREKRILVWLAGMTLVWMLLASLRAGGDQWDNPRYRTIFLPFMALLAAWAVQFARQQGDAWLGRIFIVEGIFLVFFTDWYLFRYYHIGLDIDFIPMVAIIAGLSLAALAGGWVWDRLHRNKDT